ncbi:MAG: transcription termination/antitermination NusG family protein [Planctomycetota bacterium]
MLRLQDNPPMTLPGAPPLDATPGAWSAAYCKPRQEKALAWDLCRRDVPYFLPMVQRETSSGGRRRRNMYPMFKSYLFFAGGEDERLAVTKTNRLVQLVEIDPAAQQTFRREVCSLELALQSAPERIELYPQLANGKRVLITGGPMKGAEGIILNADNPTRLWIGITMMGAGATVEIHADLVEVVKHSEPRSSAACNFELHIDGQLVHSRQLVNESHSHRLHSSP